MVFSASSFDAQCSELRVKVSEAVTELGLKPLDSGSDLEISMQFYAAIRNWQFRDLVSESKNRSRLEIIADSLNVALHHLASLSCEYTVLGLIQEKLAEEREIRSGVRVRFFLQETIERIRTLSRTVRHAETKLRPITSRRGLTIGMTLS
jgi:hypothetical protein